MKNLAKNLKLFREKTGLKKSDVCRRLGFSRSNLTRWEKGETTPGIDAISLIADFLLIDIETLIKYERKKYFVYDVLGQLFIKRSCCLTAKEYFEKTTNSKILAEIYMTDLFASYDSNILVFSTFEKKPKAVFLYNDLKTGKAFYICEEKIDIPRIHARKNNE